MRIIIGGNYYWIASVPTSTSAGEVSESQYAPAMMLSMCERTDCMAFLANAQPGCLYVVEKVNVIMNLKKNILTFCQRFFFNFVYCIFP